MSDLDLKTMKVADLRDELSKRGLDTKGVKAVLLKRLKAVLNKEAKEKEKNASEGPELLTNVLPKESTDSSCDDIADESREADLSESVQSMSVIEELEEKVTGENILISEKVTCITDKIVEPCELQGSQENTPISTTKNNDLSCEVFNEVPVESENVTAKAVNLKETEIENKDESVLESKHAQMSENRQSESKHEQLLENRQSPVDDESKQNKKTSVPFNEYSVKKRIDIQQDESNKIVRNVDQVKDSSTKKMSNLPSNVEGNMDFSSDTLVIHISKEDTQIATIAAPTNLPSTNDERQETVSKEVVTEQQSQKRKYEDSSSDVPKTEKKRERRTRWSKIEERVEPSVVEMKVEREEINDSVVTLDTYNADLNLVIEPSRYAASPLTDQGFAFMWAGARATHGVTKGKICYEVLIVKNLDVSHLPEDEPSPHVVRVGFSVESSTLQLGEDPLSYGYGGTGKISTDCRFKDYGSSFGENDVVTAFLNMDVNPVEIGFAKNGVFLGWAYKVNKSQLGNQALFPHVLTKNVSFEVNFGQREKPYVALRDGFQSYTFIGCVPAELREHGTKPPATREDCEMIMMCGLPGAGKSVWAAEFSKKHPDKKYNVLGTNNIIDKMKVMGLPRKRNYHGRWEVLIQMSTKCLNKLFEIGSKLRRNYILDQTNVYPTAQRKKMRNFEGFQRKAVVIVPTEEEFQRRCDKRDKEEGKEVPEHAVLEMKANFKLPEVCDVFDEVIFVELDRPEAEDLVRKYNAEGRAATGPPNKRFRPNDSSPGARNPRNSGDYGGSRGYRGGGRGGHDGGSFGRGGHDGGSFGRGGHDGGSFGRGGHDGGSFGRGGHDGGSFGRGGHDGGSFGRGGHDGGSFGRGGQNSGSFGRGGHDGGSFGRGGHDGSFGRGSHDGGSFGRGGHDGGSFGRGGHDGGSFGRGGQSGGSFGRGGQSGGSFGRGGQSGGSFSRGGQNSGSFGRGGQNSGSFSRGGQNSGSFGRGGQDSGSFGRGGQDSGSFGRGGQHGGSFSRGGQDGSFGRGGQSSGSFGRGGNDSGSFDQGSHDSGSYGRGNYGEQTYGSGYGNNSPSYGDNSPGGFGRGGSRGNYRGGRSQGGYGRDHTYNESGHGQESGYADDQRGYRGGGGAGGGFDSYNDNYKKVGFGNDGSSGGFKKDTGFGGRGGNSGGRGSSRGSSNRGYSGAPNNRGGGRNNRGDAGGNKTWSDSRPLQQSSGQSDQSGYGSGYGNTKTENSASSSATGYGNYNQNYGTASYESQSAQAYQQPQSSYSYQPQTSQTTPTTVQQWPASPPAPTTVPPPAVAQPTPEQIQQQWTQYYQQQSQQQYYNQYYGGTPAAAGATTTPVYGTGVYAAK